MARTPSLPCFNVCLLTLFEQFVPLTMFCMCLGTVFRLLSSGRFRYIYVESLCFHVHTPFLHLFTQRYSSLVKPRRLIDFSCPPLFRLTSLFRIPFCLRPYSKNFYEQSPVLGIANTWLHSLPHFLLAVGLSPFFHLGFPLSLLLSPNWFPFLRWRHAFLVFGFLPMRQSSASTWITCFPPFPLIHVLSCVFPKRTPLNHIPCTRPRIFPLTLSINRSLPDSTVRPTPLCCVSPIRIFF